MAPVGAHAENRERFDRFMERALYGPDGFFSTGRGRPGRRGDFITSPEIGPLFGAVVARFLDDTWERLGRPEPFHVVDVGAGPGTLLRAIRAARPRCAEALDLVAVERSPAMRAQHPDGVRSLDALPTDPFDGVVVANELLDNLPLRLLRRRGTEVEEGWVDPVEGLVPVALADPALDTLLGSLDVPDGRWVPVAEEAQQWVQATLARPGRGRLLVVDYAAPTAEIAARPLEGWLRTFRAQERGGPAWSTPGLQDITADVPLDQLPPGAAVERQDAWLRRWGVDELVEEGRRLWQDGAHLGNLEALRGRSRIREAEALLDPDGLGSFVVLTWDRPGPGDTGTAVLSVPG